MKQNVTPVPLISEKYKTRIVNTVFKVKLLGCTASGFNKKKLSLRTFFSGNFQSKFFSEFLSVACSEKPCSKTFLSNTKEAFQDQMKTISCALHTGLSEKI